MSLLVRGPDEKAVQQVPQEVMGSLFLPFFSRRSRTSYEAVILVYNEWLSVKSISADCMNKVRFC